MRGRCWYPSAPHERRPPEEKTLDSKTALRTPLPLLLCLVAGAFAAPSFGAAGDVLRHFGPERRETERELEAALATIPSRESIRDHHDLVSSRPHATGTAGDLALSQALADAFQRLGFEVERQEIYLYAPRPVSATVEIVAPEPEVLPLKEPRLAEDPYTDDPALDPGWLAYSASADVTAEVVYANHGAREDFATLERKGVKVAGKIAMIRYGGLFRGNQVANAEAAGAIGVLLYSDPADSGWGRGLSYPEGGWYSGDSIQRGSILNLPYPGDPLTPGEPAARDASRRSPDAVGLPSIPAQPLGWTAASRILSRMEGAPVEDDAWQGGLPFRYRYEGGPLLSVRLAVDQELKLRRTENVIARLPGTVSPQELVVLGCHHDAWSFGASDPNAGSIVLFEVARSFAELARRGVRPRRTLVFAHWAAEELGIEGSTEWVEAHETELRNDAVAYLNLDMAAIGRSFGAAASPSLAPLIREVAAEVFPDQAPLGPRVRDTLGGGSDHVPFAFRAGVPSAGLGVYGGDGSAYHTNYDTLRWYRKVVGPDYEGALQLARAVARIAARLANADVVPLDPLGYAGAAEDSLDELEKLAKEGGLAMDTTRLRDAVEAFRGEAEPTMTDLWAVVDEGGFTPEGLAGMNWELRQTERIWLDDEGLPGRPWYRSLLASPDPTTGYAAWSLPLLREAVMHGEAANVGPALERYERIFRLLTERFRTLRRMVAPIGAPAPAVTGEPDAVAKGQNEDEAGDEGIEEEDIE